VRKRVKIGGICGATPSIRYVSTREDGGWSLWQFLVRSGAIRGRRVRRLIADLRRPNHAQGVHERAIKAGVAGGRVFSCLEILAGRRGRRGRARLRLGHVEARQRSLEFGSVQAGVAVRVAAPERFEESGIQRHGDRRDDAKRDPTHGGYGS